MAASKPLGSNVPPLPPGFILDNAAQAPDMGVSAPIPGGLPEGVPQLPPGFVLDSQIQEAVVPDIATEEGFMERVGAQLAGRGEDVGDILLAQISDEQSTPETIFQLLGTGAGAAFDIVGEGILSAAKALPEAIKEPVVDTAANFLQTDAGKAAMSALGKGVEQWEEFKSDNPRAARNIEATFNVGAAFVPAAKAAGPVAKGAKATGRGVQKVFTKAPVVTADDISSLASNAYRRAESLGGNLRPEFTNRFLDKIKRIAPQTEVGKIIGGESPVTKMLQKLEMLRDKPISLRAAQEFDELMGDAIDSFVDAGRLTKNGKKLLEIQTTFREGIEKATPKFIDGGRKGFEALKEGRKLWSASRKLDDIERIIARADLTDNPATAIKAGFRNIVTNPKKARGFTDKELSLMKKAAKDGIVADTLRVTLGSRLLPIIATGSGGGLGASAAATAGSIATRGALARVGSKQAQKVAAEVSRRALQSQ